MNILEWNQFKYFHLGPADSILSFQLYRTISYGFNQMQILGCIKLDVLIKLVNNDRNVPIMTFCFFGYVFPGAWFLLFFCFCFFVVGLLLLFFWFFLGGGGINLRCDKYQVCFLHFLQAVNCGFWGVPLCHLVHFFVHQAKRP